MSKRKFRENCFNQKYGGSRSRYQQFTIQVYSLCLGCTEDEIFGTLESTTLKSRFWLSTLTAFSFFAWMLAAAAQEQENPESPVQVDKKAAASPTPFSWTTEDGEPVTRVANGVTPPRILKSPDPEYSAAARNSRVMGSVVLWLVVNTKGLPEQIKVQKSLGYGLDRNALEAVKKWKFAPATKNGKPVAVIINVEVNFRL